MICNVYKKNPVFNETIIVRAKKITHFQTKFTRLIAKYEKKHEVIFNGIPIMSAMEKYFLSRKQNTSRTS